MALASGFLIDPGTTAEQLAAKRRLAEALVQEGSSTAPVGHWTQGAARVAQALMGGYELNQADETQRTQREDASRRIGEALGFGGDTAPTPQSSPAPAAKPSGYGLAAQPSPASPAARAQIAAVSGQPVVNPGDPRLPAGMRNNNPGNIKFFRGATYPGLSGPSVNTDQGDPQMVFDSPQNGMNAAASLAYRKYQGGKRTALDLISGNMGWTPGNRQAAANVARAMGVAPDEDLRLDDPARMSSFLKGLTLQEHGAASRGYGDDLYSLAAQAAHGRQQPSQGAPAASVAAPQNGNLLGIDRNTATAIQKLSLNPQTAPLANKLLELALSPKDLNGRYKDTENGVMDTRTGQIIPGTGRSKFAQTGENEYGRKEYGFVNPADESVKPYRSGPQSAGGAAQGDPTDPFAGAPANVVDRAKNILAGREALPLTARGDPTALQTQALVRKVDPQFDSNRFNYRKHWEDPNSATGKTRVANNTGIAHLFELHKMLEGAPDSGLGPLSHASTALQSWYRGASNDPWLNDYLANAKTLAGEVVKVNTGGEGAESDRRGIYDTIHPSVGKEALKQTLGKYIKLFAGKTHALADDWKKNMGPYADQPQVISDENQGMLDELKKAYGVKEDGSEAPAKEASAVKLAPRPSGASDQQIIANAKQAIADGKNEAAVKQQLEAWGVKF